MDSASIQSLTPLLDGVDRWGELLPLLPIIISLELVLSADNAVALAAITRVLDTPEEQRKALNIGISMSLVLRILLILMAQWILKYKFIQFFAGIYLLSLFLSKIRDKFRTENITNISNLKNSSAKSLLSTVFLLAITDLAFSVDSVAAAVAISDQFILVTTGAVIGVIALRFTSGLFIKWLEIYSRLELAGYIAVGLVGLKLLILLLIPDLFIQESIMMSIVALLFLWGFSKKVE